jgi:hypothetical protein
MIWVQFLVTALVIVAAGVRLARYGDVLGEKSGLERSWIGVVFLADQPAGTVHRVWRDCADGAPGYRRR